MASSNVFSVSVLLLHLSQMSRAAEPGFSFIFKVRQSAAAVRESIKNSHSQRKRFTSRGLSAKNTNNKQKKGESWGRKRGVIFTSKAVVLLMHWVVLWVLMSLFSHQQKKAWRSSACTAFFLALLFFSPTSRNRSGDGLQLFFFFPQYMQHNMS